MKPDVTDILQAAFGTIFMDVAPTITHDYARGSVSTIGLMLLFAAQEYERGAAVRAEENDAMRTLFTDAAAVLPSGALKDRVTDAARKRASALTISALNAANAEAKAVVIDLHAFVETWTHAQAPALNERIWAFLRRSADGRALALPVL